MELATPLEPLKSENRLEAEKIATQTLKSNIVLVTGDSFHPHIQKKYLLAGRNQYHTLWARDLSMAIAGALTIGEHQAARDSLEIFFKLQRVDGLFPRIVDNRGIASRVVLGLLGYPPEYRAPLKGWFTTENNVISIDGNLLLPWAASQYIRRTQDEQFAGRWFKGMEQALGFIEKNFLVDGLIGNQPPFSDWEDSVRRTGRVSFTNALYIVALRGAASWAKLLGYSNKHDYYLDRTEEVTTKFRNFFWIPEKNIFRNFEGNELVTADTNLFVIANKIIPPGQAQLVLAELKNSPIWHPIPGQPTWPAYPNTLKSFLVKAVGLKGYHDSLYWIWISALAARATKTLGDYQESEKILNYLSDRIVTDRGIFEIYDGIKNHLDLRPHKGFIYQADRSFTWSSACYLEADLDRNR